MGSKSTFVFNTSWLVCLTVWRASLNPSPVNTQKQVMAKQKTLSVYEERAETLKNACEKHREMVESERWSRFLIISQKKGFAYCPIEKVRLTIIFLRKSMDC